jgi:5-methylcytosine-specific restriction endonuclease McrA
MTIGTKAKQNRRNAGKPCTYCRRTMILNHPSLKPTKDHHIPKARGGWNSPIIPACGQCNEIKGDMLP